jgi:hypothetical protein
LDTGLTLKISRFGRFCGGKADFLGKLKNYGVGDGCGLISALFRA